MARPFVKWLGCFMLIFFFLDCTKEDPVSDPMLVEPPTADGSWKCTDTSRVIISLWLREDRSKISGSATYNGPYFGPGSEYNNRLDLKGSASGINIYPNVTITLYFTGYVPLVMMGRFVSPTEILGELNQSGFSHYAITFRRQ